MQSTEQLPCRDIFIHARPYFTPLSRFLQDSVAYPHQVPLQRSHSSPATARARQQGSPRNVHLPAEHIGKAHIQSVVHHIFLQHLNVGGAGVLADVEAIGLGVDDVGLPSSYPIPFHLPQLQNNKTIKEQKKKEE